MTKIRVSKIVAEMLGNKHDNGDNFYDMYDFLDKAYADAMEKGITMVEWFESQKLSFNAFIKIIECMDWEVEYEFKEGDIVSYTCSLDGYTNFYNVIKQDSQASDVCVLVQGVDGRGACSIHKDHLKVVCKYHNREDLQ
jgi:hypothetical protein